MTMSISKHPTSSNLSNFAPSTPIKFLCSSGIDTLRPDSITHRAVGKKAFGLSCLPKYWTLPFFVISEELMLRWTKNAQPSRDKILLKWSEKVIEAAKSIGINYNDKIIVRSSGVDEGIEERGEFYSKTGFLFEVKRPLKYCIERIDSEFGQLNKAIPLIVQKAATPVSALGHLSNERRCYKELRDWLGVYEEPIKFKGIHFKINNRNWRERLNIEKAVYKPLKCNLTAHVSEILRIPSAWAYKHKVRLHFEWVWDGNNIFLVQADEENRTYGVEPLKLSELQKRSQKTPHIKFLKEIDDRFNNQYQKIRNAILYKKLGLLDAKLYILDDQNTIRSISIGHFPSGLIEDLTQLVNGSLIIRMDIATSDLRKRQLLPRTNEVRELQSAKDWLISTSVEILSKNSNDNIVFIFHNFIPAISSAFTYAAPGHRQVQIEALWGLPEGLYYNKHDKFIVDTQKSDFKTLDSGDICDYKIQSKVNFKQFFVIPNELGAWKTCSIKPPYDWRRSIKYTKWIQQLAFYSRKIAEKENRSISIMWFIGVPKTYSSNPILPWYHEPYDPKIAKRAIAHRTKTPFDKSLIISTRNDVTTLEKESLSGSTKVRRIRIQPFDEKLLRDKNTLKKIGELSTKIDAVILLEGGVLSHAYYQLMETKAIVEVRHPFSDFDDIQEFNKIVRDKIPENIESGGEIVNKAKLSGEYLLRALKEKLIEEAFEVLDAVDQESIIAEMADVNEIIDGILKQLNVSRELLNQKQDKKRERAGGFEEGIVLLKTKNPLPTEIANQNPLFQNFNPESENVSPQPDAIKAIRNVKSIEKWSDRRIHTAASETVLRLTVPMTVDSWTEKSPLLEIDTSNGTAIRAVIKGVRKGAKTQIEVSFYLPIQQLRLF